MNEYIIQSIVHRKLITFSNLSGNSRILSSEKKRFFWHYEWTNPFLDLFEKLGRTFQPECPQEVLNMICESRWKMVSRKITVFDLFANSRDFAADNRFILITVKNGYLKHFDTILPPHHAPYLLHLRKYGNFHFFDHCCAPYTNKWSRSQYDFHGLILSRGIYSSLSFDAHSMRAWYFFHNFCVWKTQSLHKIYLLIAIVGHYHCRVRNK